MPLQQVVERLLPDAGVHLADGLEERLRVEVVRQAGQELGQVDELHRLQLLLVQVKDAWPMETNGGSVQASGGQGRASGVHYRAPVHRP